MGKGMQSISVWFCFFLRQDGDAGGTSAYMEKFSIGLSNINSSVTGTASGQDCVFWIYILSSDGNYLA
jgi:hypothetical protein